MSKQVQANYDRLSRWYDLFASSEKKFTLAGVHILNVQPGERVLEIGCGTGHALGWLKQAAGPGLIVGADLSAGMLRQAQKILPGAKIPLIQTNALSLPCTPSSFDAVFLSFTLELFPNTEIPTLLKECYRALKPGGRLGVVCMAEGESLIVKLYKWGHQRWPNVLDCRPITVDRELKTAGFHVQEQKTDAMWGLPVNVVLAIRP